jgi:transposase
MKYNMKSVETVYNGTTFRSRLEANWAACFDIYRWQWTYEPFDLDGWFPDFLLKSEDSERPDVLVEVKPLTSFCEETAQKIQEALEKTDNHHVPALLVGTEPFWSEEWEQICVGWLLEYNDYENSWSWDEAPMRYVDWSYCSDESWQDAWKNPRRPKARIDFCHAAQDYRQRITGHYDGQFVNRWKDMTADETELTVRTFATRSFSKAKKQVQYQSKGRKNA